VQLPWGSRNLRKGRERELAESCCGTESELHGAWRLQGGTVKAEVNGNEIILPPEATFQQYGPYCGLT